MNTMMVAFLANTIISGTPLLFATLGEIITERVGNLNLGVEGMMLMGAVSGFYVGLTTQSSLLALIAAMLAGGSGALIYAILTVSFRTNQVVTGLALTIFGTGVSGFMGQSLVGKVTPDAVKAVFKPVVVPILGEIPYIGEIFFQQDIFIYLSYIMVVLVGIYLYKTRLGLNLRAVGENPAAADAASINVSLYKYAHILLGGALCGLGGAYLSLVYVPAWQDNITAGRGWIAVALVIFAAWNPYKALVGSYLFGGLDIIGFRIQGTGFPVSQYIIDMLPYLVTIIVLVVASLKKSKKNAPPKALGVPYFREER
ncbi:MAG: ABC transporter permease [Clostridia bacterium]|nr:ABC transporter permease [Clostridia bacterium]MDD4047387.1 ABC transporter permease [Clostridia bacterium]